MSSVEATFAEVHARLVLARTRAGRMSTRDLVGAVIAAERFLFSDDGPAPSPVFFRGRGSML